MTADEQARVEAIAIAIREAQNDRWSERYRPWAEINSNAQLQWKEVAAYVIAADPATAMLAVLQERLEMNHVFDADGKRVEVEPGSHGDGIDARDATIAGLDRQLAEARAEIERLSKWLAMGAETAKRQQAKLTEATDALRMCSELGNPLAYAVAMNTLKRLEAKDG